MDDLTNYLTASFIYETTEISKLGFNKGHIFLVLALNCVRKTWFCSYLSWQQRVIYLNVIYEKVESNGIFDTSEENEAEGKRNENSHATRGLDNAGKTTILKRFNGEDIDLISPTLGFNIKTLEHRGYKLNIWDVGGQKSLRSYWRNYFECTDGLVWVVDSADKRRLEDCKNELHQLLGEERLAGATLLVFCNKQDLPGALPSDTIKDILELDDIKTHHWHIMHCSAVTGINLLKGMDWLIDDISARIFTLD